MPCLLPSHPEWSKCSIAPGCLGKWVLDAAEEMCVEGRVPHGQDSANPCSLLQESIPFAVIGSNTVVEAKGRRVRGRLYPWGIVEGNWTLSPLSQQPWVMGTSCAHLHAAQPRGA